MRTIRATPRFILAKHITVLALETLCQHISRLSKGNDKGNNNSSIILHSTNNLNDKNQAKLTLFPPSVNVLQTVSK